MRLEDLKLFLTIAETRNLHRAADRERLSQSALTKMLRRLESELGVKLFERAPRGVELTEIGRSFAVRIRRMDLQLNQALQEVADMRLGELGVLRFGTSPALVDIVFTPAAREFLNHRPKVRYELSIQHTKVLIGQLIDGRMDLILAAVPAQIPPEVDHEVLFVQRIHVIVRRHHPLHVKADLRPADLAGAKWLLPPPGTIVRDWVEAELAAKSLPPPLVAIETEAPSSTLAVLLRQSDLVSTMSPEIMHSSLGEGLVAIDAAIQPSEQMLALLWRRDSYLAPLARDFWDVIRRVVALQPFLKRP